jgi:hypothetical protein
MKFERKGTGYNCGVQRSLVPIDAPKCYQCFLVEHSDISTHWLDLVRVTRYDKTLPVVLQKEDGVWKAKRAERRRSDGKKGVGTVDFQACN